MKFAFAPESKPLEGFTIKRAIHRGGFGEVYYALSDAGKEVALKLLRQNMDVELRGVTQCLNLKHPNLVSIFDIKTDDDGDHWIIMEYVAGKTLDGVLEEFPNGMPLEKVSKWIEQICQGLNFLHDRGIVHRDMKPANLFIEDDLIKIGDIGLSKFITQSRRSAQTQSVGTVYYMAPEVAHGRYGHEVDIYALGIILYELITGRVPFEGESTGEILMKHLTDKPDLTRLPEAYRGVVSRALEKDPQKRTSSVEQFWTEFQSAVRGNGEPVDIPETAFQPAPASKTDIDLEAGRRKNHELEITDFSSPRSGEAKTPGTAPVQPNHRAGEKPIQAGMHSVLEWYNAQHPLTQAVVVFAVLIFVLTSGILPVVLVLAICGAIGWAAYTLFTLLMNGGTASSPPPSASAPPRPTPPPAQTTSQPLHPVMHSVNHYKQKVKQKIRHWTDKEILKRTPPETPRKISRLQRITELSGSLGISALYVAIFSSLYLFVSEQSFAQSLPTIFFLGSTTLLSVWTLMTTAKLTEGTKLAGLWRRCLLLPGALLVGSAAYGLSQYLMVSPTFTFTLNNLLAPAAFNEVGEAPLRIGNNPAMDGYLVFFVTMFLVRGWWGVADSYRKKKLRIASILWSGALTYVQVLFFAFPMELALFWSVVSTAVIQLSTAWTPPRDRLYIAEEQ